jgi:mycofactocin system creatininase family protein
LSRTLVIPLGSTEQHGPHLPLDTDTVIASALAERLLAVRPDDVVLAPAIPYGASGEHAGFEGTLSIGTDALEHLLIELIRDATRDNDRVLIVNAHGGNLLPLARAVVHQHDEGRDVEQFSARWPGGDAHAGRTETSLMLALAPARVRLELAAAGATAPLLELMPALRAGGVRAVSENGVLGDPAGASAVEGEELLDAAVRDLIVLLDRWS